MSVGERSTVRKNQRAKGKRKNVLFLWNKSSLGQKEKNFSQNLRILLEDYSIISLLELFLQLFVLHIINRARFARYFRTITFAKFNPALIIGELGANTWVIKLMLSNHRRLYRLKYSNMSHHQRDAILSIRGRTEFPGMCKFGIFQTRANPRHSIGTRIRNLAG